MTNFWIQSSCSELSVFEVNGFWSIPLPFGRLCQAWSSEIISVFFFKLSLLFGNLDIYPLRKRQNPVFLSVKWGFSANYGLAYKHDWFYKIIPITLTLNYNVNNFRITQHITKDCKGCEEIVERVIFNYLTIGYYFCLYF